MLVRGLLGVTLLGLCSPAVLADEEMPEIEFLEYLGMWDGSDEDWVMFSESTDADTTDANTTDKKRSEPAPDGEDSTEKSDES